MENKKVKNFSRLESDGSHYFSTYGSMKPEITIREEIDNQIAARPNFASISFSENPNNMEIITRNDGITPTNERMQNMYRVGKSVSDRRGASICGIGQIEGLIAGRVNPKSCGTLKFESVHDGVKSIFYCEANGYDSSISGWCDNGVSVFEEDHVNKVFGNMKKMDSKEKEELEAIIGIKIHPYSLKNPKFKYTFNNKVVKPISVLYDGVEDESIKRFGVKEYDVIYNRKTYTVKVGGIEASKYVKPDGFKMSKKADLLDKVYNMSDKSGGIFVEIGGVNVITGGANSWKFVGMRHHSTYNGIRFWISIPEDGELKDAIFQESANKSNVGMTLENIYDFDGTQVFKEILTDIKKCTRSWVDNKDKATKEGKFTKEVESEIYNNFLMKEKLAKKFHSFYRSLSKKEIECIKTKKFGTLYKDFQKVTKNA